MEDARNPRLIDDPSQHASTRIAQVMLEAGADHPELDTNARLIAIVNNGGGRDDSGSVCGMGFPDTEDDDGLEMMMVLAGAVTALFAAHGYKITFTPPHGASLN